MRQFELLWWLGMFGAALAIAGLLPAFSKIGATARAASGEAVSRESVARARAKASASWHATARYLAMMLGLAILGVAWLQGQLAAWISIAAAVILSGGLAGVAFVFCGWNSRFRLTKIFQTNAVAAAVVVLVWTLAGYSMAMSEGDAAIGSLSRVFLNNTGGLIHWGGAEVSETSSILFYTAVAVCATMIAITATAPRTKFVNQIWFVAIWILFVYAPILHWVWGPGGWLSNPASGAHVLDAAGGVVVFAVGGVAGLVSLIALDRRQLAFEPSINDELILIGTALLTAATIALNTISSQTGIATVLLDLVVTIASAGLSAGFAAWMLQGRPSLASNCAGVLAGLAASASAAGILPLHFAPVTGIVAGVVGVSGSIAFGRAAPYCTALAAGGLTGSLVTSLLAAQNWSQTLNALGGVSAVLSFDMFATLLIWTILGRLLGRPETVSDEWIEDGQTQTSPAPPLLDA